MHLNPCQFHPSIIDINLRSDPLKNCPGDFIHGGGFNNTGSDGNFRMQLLNIDDGYKIYKPLKYHNDLDYINVSDKELLCYKFGEDISNYNNRSVSNYTYSSSKTIYFCHVKKHTGVDLVLGSDFYPNAKPMLPCYQNNSKLNPNLLSGVKDCHIEENKISNNKHYSKGNIARGSLPKLDRSKGKPGKTFNLDYTESVLNKKNHSFQVNIRNCQVINMNRLSLCCKLILTLIEVITFKNL